MKKLTDWGTMGKIKSISALASTAGNSGGFVEFIKTF